MSTKSFENTKLWLLNHSYEMVSDAETYNATQSFKFKCGQNHDCELTCIAFKSRKSRAKRTNQKIYLCDECKPEKQPVVKAGHVNLGPIKFQNYCEYLKQIDFEVESTFEDFMNNEIAFKCLQGHTTNITVTYFGVRKHSKVIANDPRLLCGHCNVKGEILSDKLEALQITVKEKSNHKILSLERGRKITYECGSCGEIRKSTGPNLTTNGLNRSKGYCSHCLPQNYQNIFFNRKQFTFPSGKVVNVLGYEPLCLQELLKTYQEHDIITDGKLIPVFLYDKIKNGCSYRGRYYPDIMVPDKIIEVKSTYTFEMDKENNMRKMKAVVQEGYNFEFWIYDAKHNLMVIKKDDI